MLITHDEPRRQVRAPDTLASGPISCAAASETTLKSVSVANGLYAELASLAYAVNGAPGAGIIEFRFYISGVRATFPKATRSTQLGEIGAPSPVVPAREMPNAADVEIRVYNADPALAWECECDGEIAYYDKPPR